MSQELGISCNAFFLIVISCKVPLLDLLSCKSDSWKMCTCTNVFLVCEVELGQLGQPDGM